MGKLVYKTIRVSETMNVKESLTVDQVEQNAINPNDEGAT